MATNYTGYQPKTMSAILAGRGRWISGYAVDDGDLDDAQHLMALVMATMDCVQFLGWRSIDWLSLSTPSGYTPEVNVTFNEHDSFGWFFNCDCHLSKYWLTGSGTLHVGGTLYVGSDTDPNDHGYMNVAAGSRITVQGQLVMDGASSLLKLDDGAQLLTTTSSPSTFNGSVALNGGTTQTAPFQKSGNGAVTGLRTATIPSHGPGGPTDPNVRIVSSQADVWYVPTDIDASIEIFVTFEHESTNHEFCILLQEAGNLTPHGGNGTCMEIYGLTDKSYLLGRFQYIAGGGFAFVRLFHKDSTGHVFRESWSSANNGEFVTT